MELRNGERGYSIANPQDGQSPTDVHVLRVTLDFTGQVIIDCQVADGIWQEVAVGDFEGGKVELESNIGRLDVPALEAQLARAEAMMDRPTEKEDRDG